VKCLPDYDKGEKLQGRLISPPNQSNLQTVLKGSTLNLERSLTCEREKKRASNIKLKNPMYTSLSTSSNWLKFGTIKRGLVPSEDKGDEASLKSEICVPSNMKSAKSTSLLASTSYSTFKKSSGRNLDFQLYSSRKPLFEKSKENQFAPAYKPNFEYGKTRLNKLIMPFHKTTSRVDKKQPLQERIKPEIKELG